MNPSFLICGIEHSGTTLLSDIFRQVPSYDSGFEVGVLLCESPKAFRSHQPFVGNLCSGWGVLDSDLDYLCDADAYETFYARLWERSPVVDKRKPKFFDKTPRYLAKLNEVSGRMTCPIFVCHKDPRSIVASDFQRASTKNFEEWYEKYLPAKQGYMRQLYKQYQWAKAERSKQCMPVRLESLCLESRKTLNSAFDFIGERFELSYLNFSGLRYAHTKAPYIASNIPFQYLLSLSPAQCSQIERDFDFCSEWFYV